MEVEIPHFNKSESMMKNSTTQWKIEEVQWKRNPEVLMAMKMKMRAHNHQIQIPYSLLRMPAKSKVLTPKRICLEIITKIWMQQEETEWTNKDSHISKPNNHLINTLLKRFSMKKMMRMIVMKKVRSNWQEREVFK